MSSHLSTSVLEICELLCQPLKCANQIFILTPGHSEVHILLAATLPPCLVSIEDVAIGANFVDLIRQLVTTSRFNSKPLSYFAVYPASLTRHSPPRKSLAVKSQENFNY